MHDFDPPEPTAGPLPAADLQATAVGSVEYESYPVRRPEADLNDFKVQVRASTLSRCRGRLASATRRSFPWHELALGISTLAGGGVVGALPANITAGSTNALFFFSVLPVIAAASFVAYLFLRGSEVRRSADAVADALAELPNPDETR